MTWVIKRSLRKALQLALLVPLLLSLTWGCSKAERQEEVEQREREQSASRVLGRINGEGISVARFEATITSMPSYLREAVQGQTGYMRIFGEMINFVLLRQMAVEQGLQQDAWVQLHTREQMIEQRRQELGQETAQQVAPPTPEDVEAALRAEPERWQSPEQLTVDLLFTRSPQRARRLMTAFAMLRGASLWHPSGNPDALFLELARSYTEESPNQASLGPFSRAEARGALDDAVADALFAEAGLGLRALLSLPQSCCYLVNVRERIAAKPLPASELRVILANDALEAAAARAWQAHVAEVMATARVEILEPSLSDAISGSTRP
ncbi:MAG: peptidylprolyl isomerase [Myxococcota bacterium]|jgi:hypothetical protein|nr:peptidylprolyl isomerase [Myxococcota bacterium]